MGHSVNGRNLCGIISGYLVIKCILNLILGFGFSNILHLVIAVAIGYVLISGIKYSNYVTAILVAFPVVANMKDNIANSRVLYIIEAVIDIVCIVELIINKDIKEHCKDNEN